MTLLTLVLGCVGEPWEPPGLALGANPDWAAPENRWPAAAPPADLSGEGFATGQVAPDLRLRDQHGDEVSLWQFYGSVVLLDLSIVQCPPCWDVAPVLQGLWVDHDGLVPLTALQSDAYNSDPHLADLVAWADEFGLTHPVLDDGLRLVDTIGWPNLILIDRQMRVVDDRVPHEEDLLRELVEAELAR